MTTTARVLLSVYLLATLACLAGEAPRPVTFRLDLSVKDILRKQDWSGSARVSAGRIVRVGKTSGASDSIRPDGSWLIVYGRSLDNEPDRPPREKALLLTVEAPEDALITVTTAAGEVSFRPLEVPAGKPIERLGGNLRISRGSGETRPAPANPDSDAVDYPEIPSEAITDGALQSEWPALAVDARGITWAAFVEWNGRDADRVRLLRRPPGGAWADVPLGDDGSTDHYRPAVTAVGDAVVVAWSAARDGNWDLFAATVAADGTAGAPRRVTTEGNSDLNVRLATDARGRVVMAWQSFRSGHSDILASVLQDGTWAAPVRVSPSEANDWEPEVAADSAGGVWIVWDSYDAGNYDVFLRRFDGGDLGPVVRVTSETSAQFHASVAVDAADRVWVAWDDGGENWGKDLSASGGAPDYRGLHASRTIGVRVVAGGNCHDVSPQPSAVLTGRMAQFAELPQLAVDAAGTVRLLFRHWSVRRPMEMYHVFTTSLTAAGWSEPLRLGGSSGRNTQWASAARNPAGGLLAAYATDGRAPDSLPKDQLKASIYACRLAALPAVPGDAADPVLTRVDVPDVPPGFRPRERATLEVGGKTRTLMMGDCHRHTDIRGHSAVDASILDTFRYALDAAQLDYMGLGDHNEVFGGRWPDGLRDYQWWWTQKAVDLFTCPPTFIGIYSYEHSMNRPGGHRNLLFLKRGAPLRAIDRNDRSPDNPANQPPELWKWVEENVLTQPGQKCVIVPHTFAAGPLADWNWPNAGFDCLLEIYQGCRGSYEAFNLPKEEKRGGTQTKEPGHFARDALAKGNVYGFVSFSDHRSTHNSWGCVWVETVSREGLFDAMLGRQTYAASDEIVLKVTADGRYVGGDRFEAQTDAPPEIRIEVEAPDEIRRVDVVKNGRYVWTKNPGTRSFRASFRDADVEPGEVYYYVRIFQRDPDKPDGDPEIAWSSPFYVTYR